ncbi:hypothetical protein A2U01_0002842 [Trifolium medium]|uniref:Uncharacterized protein n=1 Tax=Trifolium medium TaxID=97028 RepID=A0A392M3Z6_9FABA|nr:hypothetical protein [Trifolium medium]
MLIKAGQSNIMSAVIGSFGYMAPAFSRISRPLPPIDVPTDCIVEPKSIAVGSRELDLLDRIRIAGMVIFNKFVAEAFSAHESGA